MVLMDGWRSRGRMGTMKRGRFVKITVAESSLCGRGPLWTWIFLFIFFYAKGKRKLLLRDNRQASVVIV